MVEDFLSARSRFDLPQLRASRLRRFLETLESRVLFATTVFSDGFEGTFLNGWTNRTAANANASTRWGLNSARASAGVQSVFSAAVQGGVTSISGYQNNQDNSLVRENVSLAGLKIATLSFDYFLNVESGYDVFSVAVLDSVGARTTVFTESGNFASAGWRHKTLDLSAFSGKSDLDIEFRFQSDSSVTNEGGGVWIDEAKLVGDSVVPPASLSGRVFNDVNGNKIKDTSETSLANWRVYLDQNRNGVRDTSEASQLTDANGNYTFNNLAPGTYYIAEEIQSGFTQTSPGALGASSGSAFKIDVSFPDSTISATQRAAFTDAANRWAQIIVGDIPDISDSGTIIDDLLITATAPSIDGRGGILGQSAPTGFRVGSDLPFKGFMEFDTSDLAQLEADGQLTRVILHEMGHVLGLGTIWASRGLVQGSGTSDPRFTGPNATARFNSIFSTTGSSVPLESGGGAGTAESHWRESTLGNELMTGYLNSGGNPLSPITVGSMADIGYTVSYSAADAFTAASAATASFAAGPSQYTSGLVGAPEGPKAAVVDPAYATASAAALSADGTILGYAHTVFVDTGVARTGLDFGNRTTNVAPTITTLTDSPDPVTAGATLTLTATGVADANGTVSKVSFYRESNGVAGLQSGTGGDTLVGADTSSSGGWVVTLSTSGLAPATYTYYAQATDNAGAVSAAASRGNTVKAPTTLTTGSISGTVFNDLNGNGVKETGEPALANWRVYIDSNKNSRFDTGEKNILTGTSGTYNFTSLSAGTYNIREVDQSGWNRTASSPVVTLTSGQSATGKNFANFRNASISGTVFDDTDGDGVRDSGEPIRAGVTVLDDMNGNGIFDAGERSTTTNTSGNFTLGSLTAGTRTLRIVVPTGRTLTLPSSGSYKLTPTSGQAITGKSFGTKRTTAVKVAGLSLLDAAV
jgi:protocatechuate 3,4-dioxygenase beta subunit